MLGVNVYVHFTFVFLVAWVALTALFQGAGLTGAVTGVLFLAAVFAVVVLHELGHAMAARYYGIPTRNITLYPIGGVAQLQRMPTDPKQELVIALAGPLVNFVLAGILYLIYIPVGSFTGLVTFSLIGTSFLANLIWVNLVLAVFNLLPAFPMDGGRVLRAVLAMNTDYLKATSIAVRTGKIMAVVFGIAGFYYNPFLILIAGFIWFAGSQELRAVQYRLAMEHSFTGGSTDPRYRLRTLLDELFDDPRLRHRDPRGQRIDVTYREE